MNFRTIAAIVMLFVGGFVTVNAQVKIGYTNIELVLAYMPEAKVMEQSLATYQQKLGEQLQVKQKYAQSKLEEYQEKATSGKYTPEQLKPLEDELMKLEREIQEFVKESEYKVLTKRQELLEPILEKLQNAIDTIAEEGGYTYVLNQTTSGGVSTILYGPEEDNLTEKLMSKLGIKLPEETNGN